MKPKIFTIWPFIEKVYRPLGSVTNDFLVSQEIGLTKLFKSKEITQQCGYGGSSPLELLPLSTFPLSHCTLLPIGWRVHLTDGL